jgi:hypothetical protein
MIRLREEIVSKQVTETANVVNVQKDNISNMVDVRACNKPVERVSLLYLFRKYENFVMCGRRRVLSVRRGVGVLHMSLDWNSDVTLM